MATLLDLFKSQKNELYGGISGKTYIESRGVINPSRVAALATSSPNQLGDLIGNQVGGILLGSANRPSDTIFRNQSAISKPVSLGKTQEGLKTATDTNTSYYVKQSPAPSSLLASYKQGATTIGGMAINTAINSITKGGLAKLAENLKEKTNDTESYGVEYLNGKTENIKFSKYYRKLNGGLRERASNNDGVKWDVGQSKIQSSFTLPEKELNDSKYQNHVITTFELIKNQGETIEKIPFIGTITGITEDISPEWDSFKYIGSPFNIYRYKGVERTLQFDLKLYYTTSKERDIMIQKINYLKELAFPDKNIKTITFNSSPDSQYAMAPNLVKVSIGELYKGISVIIDNLSFTIDDNTSWSRYNAGDNYISRTTIQSGEVDESDKRTKLNDFVGIETVSNGRDQNFMYPSIIDVSISMKIIETHGITTTWNKANPKVNTKTYRYNFDGRQTDKINKEFVELLQQLRF
jgi:hypothetical protein